MTTDPRTGTRPTRYPERVRQADPPGAAPALNPRILWIYPKCPPEPTWTQYEQHPSSTHSIHRHLLIGWSLSVRRVGHIVCGTSASRTANGDCRGSVP